MKTHPVYKHLHIFTILYRHKNTCVMAMNSSGSPEKQNPQDGNTVGGGPGFAMVVGHPRTDIFKKKFF